MLTWKALLGLIALITFRGLPGKKTFSMCHHARNKRIPCLFNQGIGYSHRSISFSWILVPGESPQRQGMMGSMGAHPPTIGVWGVCRRVFLGWPSGLRRIIQAATKQFLWNYIHRPSGLVPRCPHERCPQFFWSRQDCCFHPLASLSSGSSHSGFKVQSSLGFSLCLLWLSSVALIEVGLVWIMTLESGWLCRSALGNTVPWLQVGPRIHVIPHLIPCDKDWVWYRGPSSLLAALYDHSCPR